MKAFVLAASAVAALAVAGPSLAQDHHDDHGPAMAMRPMAHHHVSRMHEVCLVRHGHRVCHMVRR
jgi:hypothetical protein